MKFKNENEENENEDKYEKGEFKKVPIENNQVQPIEIYSTEPNCFNLLKIKIKNKLSIIILIFLIFSLFLISKRMIFNIRLPNEINDEEENKNTNIIKDTSKINKRKKISEIKEDLYINLKSNNDTLFYIFQNKEKIDMKSFASREFKNPQNIKLIEKLEVSLDLEYENFVHLKIKDAANKRWEVPENDILNKEYLKNRFNHKIPITKNLSEVESSLFTLEFNSIKNSNDNNNDIYEEFNFKLLDNDFNEFYSFSTDKNFLFSDNYINFESKLTSDNIYGFGERTHDFKLDNKLYTIWPNDCGGTEYDKGEGGMNQYSHQPIGLHKTKYENLWLGFVFLNTNAQDVIISSSNSRNSTYLTHKTIGGIIDYYIIVNNSPEEIIRNINYLVGIPTLPPFWSLGYHQSRYGYKNFEEFKNVYEKFKEYNISSDAMWIDIDSYNNFEIFTLNKNFEPISDYIKNNIHKDGGKFVPIIDLGISYEDKENPYIKLGNSLDIFIKSNYTKNPLIGKCWKEINILYPDFLNPKTETFWSKGLEDYYNLVEYDGIWLDMNEPANLLIDSYCKGEVASEEECTKDKNKFYEDKLAYFPGNKDNLSIKSISENGIVYDDNIIYNVKPLISYYQSKYTYEHLDKKMNIRPFILSRSTTLGSGKFAFHWLGDNFSYYGDLKNSISGIFNFNIFGIPFTGSDICGFMNNANKELCIRWYNLGVFYPFTRNHNFFNSKDQYPWSFGNDGDYNAIEIIKKDINYKYSLLRYMYSQFFLISLNEIGSFFKPLMFEFPEEKTSYDDIESKIMFGEAFLICAFFKKGEKSKKFNLPNDNFNEYPNGKTILNKDDKNRIIELSGKLDKIHIFLRGGFIVPNQNTFEKYILNSFKLRNENLNLIINPNNNKKGRGEIFFDNNDINPINNETYYRVDMFFDENKLFINTYKNKMKKYNYKDNILGKIEIWRANEIFEIEKGYESTFYLNIFFNDREKEEETIKGIFDKENNKVIFDITINGIEISIFDISDILFNNI